MFMNKLCVNQYVQDYNYIVNIENAKTNGLGCLFVFSSIFLSHAVW